MTKRTIVLADDERGIRQYCKEELEAAGYGVVLAGDGEDALDVVETFAVDAVVLDECMPRCSGSESARRIKASKPHLPVVLFTADPDNLALKGPFIDRAVQKSEDLSELKRVLNSLLADRLENSVTA